MLFFKSGQILILKKREKSEKLERRSIFIQLFPDYYEADKQLKSISLFKI